MARFFPVRSQCQFDTPVKWRFAAMVLSVGCTVVTELLSSRDADEDGVTIIVPESTGHCDAFPEPHPLRRPLAGMGLPGSRAYDDLGNGRALSGMAVIYRSTSQAQAAEHALTQAALAYAYGANSRARTELYGSENRVAAFIPAKGRSSGRPSSLVLTRCRKGRCRSG